MEKTKNNVAEKGLESYFRHFRNQTIGHDYQFDSPYGNQKLIYADWIASGRMYEPIERIMHDHIYPLVGNTHTETTITGSSMTMAYHDAKMIIKRHVHAGEKDILISSNSGMTGVVNKLQRIIGFKIHEKYSDRFSLTDEERPIVFCTHMEHHSNQTTWLETIAQVEVIQACPNGNVDLNHLAQLLEKYQYKKTKIAAITSCSNVTGIFTPYHEIAAMMHRVGGWCFVDFACSAPYVDINMRPENPEEHLDAIYFSPHKFLGGPSSSGILIFNPKLYTNRIPDNPGGGTVDWTNPWGEHKYHDEIEAREDGGTPSFLQTIRVAYAIKLKEAMGTKNIRQREDELLEKVWPSLSNIENLHILAPDCKERLGVISFYIEGLHYNLAVKLLNDRYGIQVRGGCSCAGTYGHYLLQVSQEYSKHITNHIDSGDLALKPGWIRLSLHPTLTNEETDIIINAIESLAMHHKEWAIDYTYDRKTNEFYHKDGRNIEREIVDQWYRQPLI